MLMQLMKEGNGILEIIPWVTLALALRCRSRKGNSRWI